MCELGAIRRISAWALLDKTSGERERIGYMARVCAIASRDALGMGARCYAVGVFEMSYVLQETWPIWPPAVAIAITAMVLLASALWSRVHKEQELRRDL